MSYGLYNKANEKYLTHPKVGIWFTNDFKEAESMLSACKEYLESSGLGKLSSDFIIIDLESNEELKEKESQNAESPTHDCRSAGS